MGGNAVRALLRAPLWGGGGAAVPEVRVWVAVEGPVLSLSGQDCPGTPGRGRMTPVHGLSASLSVGCGPVWVYLRSWLAGSCLHGGVVRQLAVLRVLNSF